MKALRNLVDDSVLIINDSDITEGYMHDTYGNYGAPCSSYDAGDWCFEQSDFQSEAKKYAESKIGEIDWYKFDVDVIGDKKVDIIPESDKSAELSKKIEDLMNEWAEENYRPAEATYITYWDGHNFQSIVLESEGYSSETWELLEGEEEKKYLDIYNRANFGAWDQGTREDTVDGYTVLQSCWEGSFEIATIFIPEPEEY
jgi:hypothetical protein